MLSNPWLRLPTTVNINSKSVVEIEHRATCYSLLLTDRALLLEFIGLNEDHQKLMFRCREGQAVLVTFEAPIVKIFEKEELFYILDYQVFLYNRNHSSQLNDLQ